MPPIRPELLDELLKHYKKLEDLLGEDGLLKHLTKSLVKRTLIGDFTHHLRLREALLCRRQLWQLTQQHQAHDVACSSNDYFIFFIDRFLPPS